MRIIQEFNATEYKKLVEDFYNYFEDGYKFEEFLKSFLELIGLSEVVVTKRSRDNGIDLTGIKNGISELNNKDNVKYIVQAKRNNPNKSISPEKIDALRGNLKFNEKGLFITTAKVSDNAKQNAMLKDETKPVIVIDGLDLVKICIDKQFGFAYKPVFSAIALNEIMNKNDIIKTDTFSNALPSHNFEQVEKLITSNDIRCHMISIPRYIVDNIQDNTTQHPIDLFVNGEKQSNIKFCASRNYLSGVTDILRKNGLLFDDGVYVEKQALWSIDKDNQVVYLLIK